ncbi:hypothetical protein LMG27174_02822 [Paraburkholderia rhynchosiae]|uniref:Uncharacterized protein n=1 Tax=Paraburkholderia rhynchosiae TaxID=487049 RepID=A0A6J5AYG2_9BURK|nr:hypothetical protein LMG27174_02822 [Paraburkholderia rhynchosiae]
MIREAGLVAGSLVDLLVDSVVGSVIVSMPAGEYFHQASNASVANVPSQCSPM